MAVSQTYLPHRKFASASKDGGPGSIDGEFPAQLLTSDWILGFKNVGGAPIKFTLDALKDMIVETNVDPNTTYWFVPLSTQFDDTEVFMVTDPTWKNATERNDPPATTEIDNVIGATTYNVIRMNQNWEITDLPAYILKFDSDTNFERNPDQHNASKGSSAISYEPRWPTDSGGTASSHRFYDGNDNALTGRDSHGPTVMEAFHSSQIEALPNREVYKGGIMVRSTFEDNGIIRTSNPLGWYDPAAAAFAGEFYTYKVPRQEVKNSKFQPWVEPMYARSDNLGSTVFPTSTGQRYELGSWWSSAGTVGLPVTWTNLTKDISGQQVNISAAYNADTYYPLRQNLDYLITAHWGLKNLKPCVIVWRSSDPHTSTEFPQTRPANWLYQGALLQPGDIYFFIDDSIV
jgi:hypothetical protein